MLKMVLVFSFLSSPLLAFDQSHKLWTTVLSTYRTRQGFVKYKKLKADMKANPAHKLSTYLNNLQKVSHGEFKKFSRNDQMAFLINSYNALTVKLIIDHYPVKSIKDIGSLFSNAWKKEFFSLLSGKIKSLDPIEHKFLRPHYKDYRIHAAANCASFSCPILRGDAFVGRKLSAQLDEQMKLWLNDSKRNQYKGNTWHISKIFDWYEEDFVKWGKGVEAVIRKYASGKVGPKKGDVELEYLNYGWTLNEAK